MSNDKFLLSFSSPRLSVNFMNDFYMFIIEVSVYLMIKRERERESLVNFKYKLNLKYI